MGGLRHGEVQSWLRVTRQDANLSLTGSGSLLRKMERDKTISLVQRMGAGMRNNLRHSGNTY